MWKSPQNKGLKGQSDPLPFSQVADIKHHVPALIGIVSGASTGAPLVGAGTSVGEMLRVLAASSQRLGSPPQADDEAALHVPDRKPRQARGWGGRQTCPPLTRTGVSTPEWRRLRGHTQGHPCCSWGHAWPCPDTFCPSPPHPTPVPSIHTQKRTFQPPLVPGDRCATSLIRKKRMPSG